MATGKQAVWGNIGTGEYGRITLEDVKNNFKNYNFIIKTKHFTLDTTKFYGCAWVNNFSGLTTTPESVGTMIGTTKALYLYNVKNPKLPDSQIEDQLSDVTELVIIPVIEDNQAKKDFKIQIQVKSKRNFMLNQYTSKKL